MFSPYYFWRGRQAPDDHCALNVALYGRRGTRWSMTERGRHAVTRDASSFGIGPSRLTWDGTALTVTIDETAVPHLTAIRGTVRLIPEALTDYETGLDADGLHRWRPFAPMARIEVALERPSLRWSGHGYLDANAGARPLDEDFVHWNWSRSRLGAKRHRRPQGRILYEADRRDGSGLGLNLRVHGDGRVEDAGPAPASADLPRTLWRVGRATRSEGAARVVRALEDAPFYTRAFLETVLEGAPTQTVHESLDFDRFRARWVKALLPWRMPRATWWGG